MRRLDINVERPRAGIGEVRDRIISRRYAVERDPADPVSILFEETIAENADCIGICGELLDDQIVVFARFDIGAVLAKPGADCLY